MKRVLFVATVDEHIRHFHLPYLRWFHERGYEVHVASNGSEKFEYCGEKFDLPYQRTPFSGANLRANRMLRELCEKYEYEIVHFHTPVASAFGRWAVRKLPVKVLYTAHGFHFFKGAPLLNWLMFYPAERIMAHYTDALITINGEDFGRAKKFKLRNGGKVYAIHGIGFDSEKFAKAEVEQAAKDTVKVFSVGEVNRRKNHLSIARAISKISGVKLCYEIAGGGEYGKELAKKAAELGVELRLLGYRRDISKLMSQADIFAFPSWREGLPVSLLEAMACGLPCVASDIRGNRDLICDGKNGFLCGKNDIKAYTAAIQRLASDCELRKSVGRAAANSIGEYSIENVLQEMAGIYLRYMEVNDG